MEKYSKLFEPVNIGSMEVKNRIVLPPMVTVYASPDGRVTQKLINYHVERTRGGVGLITLEASAVHAQGRAFASTGIYDDAFITGLRRLTDSVHENGAKISIQLYHAGRQAEKEFSYMEIVSSSSIPTHIKTAFPNLPPIWLHETPRSLSVKEIWNIVKIFGEATRRAVESGFDAVELHGAHGYLIEQFLSPFMNKRKDEFGGNLESRVKFLLEIVREIRNTQGNFPIIVRLSIDEHVPGGLTIKESKKIAKMLEEAGVNAIHCSGGIYESRPWTTAGTGLPQVLNLESSTELKKILNIPVILVGRIFNLETANKIISEGKADLVAMGRSHLADPWLIKKTQEGREDDIIPCIACNQACHGRLAEGVPIGCLMNPETGREGEYTIEKTAKPRNIVVVGGGPGGTEVARVAALRGHKVTLFEKNSKIGGQILLSTAVDYKIDFKRMLEYYERQLPKLGVDLHLNKEATVQDIKNLEPDVVIIATGAVAAIPNIPGIKQKNVITAFDILRGGVKSGKKVAVLGGNGVGLDVAVFLTEQGKKVTVLEMLEDVGKDVGPSEKMFVLEQLKKAGCKMMVNSKVTKIASHRVTVLKKGKKKIIGDFDNIILALGTSSNQKLYHALKKEIFETYLIGDALKPQKALEAISTASNIGRII